MASYFPALEILQTGFEGCEKRLFVYFDRLNKEKNDFETMRDIDYDKWVEILKAAKCSILNVVSNDHCTAYLLSESSLFVFDEKIMIKTCGTTTLLLMLPSLFEEIEKKNFFVQHLTFSRSNFMFPSNQPEIHQSFQTEANYLDKYFKNGNAIVLGPLNCARWHVYTAGQLNITNDKNCLEIVMFDLDETVMNYFFKKNLEHTGIAEKDNKNYQNDITDYLLLKTGLMELFKDIFHINNKHNNAGMFIDGFIFHPCGFSLNLVYLDKYVTIHITPEPIASFVSFEILNIPNVKNQQYLIQHLLSIFRPKRFSIAVTHYKNKNYFDLSSYFDHFDSDYMDDNNKKYFYSLKNHSSHIFSKEPFYTIASGNWNLVIEDAMNNTNNNSTKPKKYELISKKHKPNPQNNVGNVDMLLSLTMNAFKELEEMREIMKDHTAKTEIETKIKNMRKTLLDMASVHQKK